MRSFQTGEADLQGMTLSTRPTICFSETLSRSTASAMSFSIFLSSNCSPGSCMSVKSSSTTFFPLPFFVTCTTTWSSSSSASSS